MADYTVVEDAAALDDVVSRLVAEPAYAIDTEFHREKTYYPKLALVQLADREDLWLVDPLATDPGPLAALFESDAVAVVHAADQDLEVLEHACGVAPEHLFDTQIAAGFLGLSTPSLATLHENLLGIRLPKGDRLTDWLRRPLDQGQLDYAASDVEHLLEIRDRQLAALTERGRVEWAQDEFEELRDRPRGQRDPAEAWHRIKEARQLRGKARAAAVAVAAWREKRAQEIDQPPRFVLSDLGVVGVAQRRPRTVGELKKIRGIDGRHLNGGQGEQILDAVHDAEDFAKSQPPKKRASELERDLRPVVGLVAAWVAQLGRELEIDPALMATRADVEAFLRGDDGRLSHGWRAELLGTPIESLVEGRASLAFERGRGLVIEDRATT